MEWSTAYMACFILGVTFVALSALVGQFGGHGDGGGGHDVGGHHVGGGEVSGGDAGHGDTGHGDSAGKVGLPLFSPTVLAVFVGMFGAGGLLLHRVLGFGSPLIHLGGAVGISGVSGVSVAWMMAKLLTGAETNAMATHREVVGQTAKVVAAIRGDELGQVAYTAGGTYQTLIARGAGGASFSQDEEVQVLEVVDGIASVGPVGSPGAQKVSVVPAGSVGVPVEKERVK